MRVEKLKISSISVGDRLRGIDRKKVERIKESISRIGLINPITVSNGVLVAGLHRLTAYKELSIEEIDCNVIGGDELLNREIEIDENLHRNELTALERGRMEAIKKSHEPEWQKRQYVIPYEATQPTTVYEYVRIDSIAPEAKDNIIGTDFENKKTFLLALSELSQNEQISITSHIPTTSKSEIEDIMRTMRAEEYREKYSERDKNQVKFRLNDDQLEKIEKLVKLNRMRSVSQFAKASAMVMLGMLTLETPCEVDDEVIKMFDDLSGKISREEYQDTKTGRMI